MSKWTTYARFKGDSIKVDVTLTGTSRPGNRLWIRGVPEHKAAEAEAVFRNLGFEGAGVQLDYHRPHGAREIDLDFQGCDLGIYAALSGWPIGPAYIGQVRFGGRVSMVRGQYGHMLVSRNEGRAVVAPVGGLLPDHPRLARVEHVRDIHDFGEHVSPVATREGSEPLPEKFAGVEEQLRMLAAARRPVVLVGPNGSGKTMVARRLPALLPPLPDRAKEDILRIQTAAGLEPSDVRRPFRAPHYTVSEEGLASRYRINEFDLAQYGVLFLDEVHEFTVLALEGLRAATKRPALAERPWLVCSTEPKALDRIVKRLSMYGDTVDVVEMP